MVDNLLDRDSKYRQCRGERHHSSKLTEDDIMDIRKLLGVKLHREIADMYGVSRGAISKIARGESWKGVGS